MFQRRPRALKVENTDGSTQVRSRTVHQLIFSSAAVPLVDSTHLRSFQTWSAAAVALPAATSEHEHTRMKYV